MSTTTIADTTEMQLIRELGISYRELALHLTYTEGDPGQFQFLARVDMHERIPVTDAQVRTILDIFSGVLDDVED